MVKAKTATYIDFNMQINFYCLWYANYFYFYCTFYFYFYCSQESQCCLNVWKQQSTYCTRTWRHLKFWKLTSWRIFWNVIFKSTWNHSQPRKSLIWKFATHRVVGLKLANLLSLNSHWDRLTIRWLTVR